MKNQYLLLFLAFLIICSPNLLIIYTGIDSVTGTLAKKIVFLLLSTSLISVPLYWIKPKIYFSFLTIIIPIIFFELYHTSTFQAISSEEAILSIYLTNYHEASELLSSNLPIVLIALIALSLYIYAILKLKPSFVLSKKSKNIILLSFITILSILFIRNSLLAYKMNDNWEERVRACKYSFNVLFRKTFPTSFFMKASNVIKGMKSKEEYQKGIENFSFSAKKIDSINQQEIYVLVIGETARKHNFGVYNYKRNTTPNLDTIKNLAVFKSAKTSANVTSLSIPFMLTRATPGNINIKLNEPCLVTPFKEAGFKTYWLSNQTYSVGSIFGFYADQADVYKNVSTTMDSATLDGTLLPILDKVITDNSANKKLIILHTIGSHFRYNYRYPQKYNVFTPTLEKGLSIEGATNISKKTEITNSYDNSIRYTDYFLHQVIDQLKQSQAISFMYYISDHGENLFDDGSNKIVHGYNIPSKYELEIPLIIWFSDLYKNTFPEKFTITNQNVNQKVSSVNTFHTLLDLSNIYYPNQNLSKSFSNRNFDTLQKRRFYAINKKVLDLE